MNETLMQMMTLVLLLNGSVDQEATINNTFEVIINNTQYEFNWWLKLPWLFELTRKGDCTDFAYISQRKLFKYGISTRRMHGMAICYNKRVRHDWLIWNDKDYDGGVCHVFERGAII